MKDARRRAGSPDLPDQRPGQLRPGGTEPGPTPIWRDAKAHLQQLIQGLDPGQALPTYAELAAGLGCSLAPVKQAVRELAAEGWISVQRGRPARVLWTGSFSANARRLGHRVTTRTFHTAYRPLEASEGAIGGELGLAPDQPCIVCGRLRIIDEQAAALNMTYINPAFFADPSRFFLDHDVAAESLRSIYGTLGARALRIPAVLKPALADERERLLLGVSNPTPVLRVHQTTLVEWHGAGLVLEVMNATYTAEVDYRVDRLADWTARELAHDDQRTS